MTNLTSLEACLAQALCRSTRVRAEEVGLSEACGHILADDLEPPHDLPPAAEALRAGFAVAALDLVSAGAGNPIPLDAPVRVLPGDRLPPGADAVLPEDGADSVAGIFEAVRPVRPGEGVRRAGHDAREGEAILRAGQRLSARRRLVAELAGARALAIRRPRVRVMLDDPLHAAFARAWIEALGAAMDEEAPHLTVRTAADHRPRLALAPAETAWLERDGSSLMLTVPSRFDGMVAAFLALALPAMSALTGAAARLETRPLARKATSTVGLSELVLLAEDGEAWAPSADVTVTTLAAARAFAILPPQSEGLPAGAPLAAIPLDTPFG